LQFDLSQFTRDDVPRPTRASPKEQVLFNRYGRAVYRLKGDVLYDYRGRPRGFVVGTAVYDLRVGHRGFWQNLVLSDRMRRVIGFAQGARVSGLALPPIEIPPLPYTDLPAPALPDEAVDLECPAFMPAWSMMQLENLLPIEETNEEEDK